MEKLQIELALGVLTKMDKCISTGVTYLPGSGEWGEPGYVSPFNLTNQMSTCWHVYAHTPGDVGIGIDFLRPVIEELGYKDVNYPVESTLMPSGNEQVWNTYFFQNGHTLYDTNTPHGKVRHMLIEKLIEYFENKLK